MMRLPLLALLTVSTALSGWAAERTPRSIVEAVFAPAPVENKREIYTGEMLEHVNAPAAGERIGAEASREVRELEIGESAARFAVAVKDAQTTRDFYVFLRKVDGHWKVEAIRTLAQTGVIELLVAALRRQKTRKPEMEWQLRNSELLLASDVEIKAFLVSNLAAFEQMLSLAKTRKKPEADAAAAKLFLSGWTAEAAGYWKFTIGGIIDNSAGYMCIPKGLAPPPVDPGNIIYLEKITGCWYVFKTT